MKEKGYQQGKKDGHIRLRNGVSKSRCIIMELPLVILNEIFFLLPIASILTCKCVCKQWLKILKSHEFTYNYAPNTPFSSFIVLHHDRPRLYVPPTRHSSLIETADNGDSFWIPMQQILIPPGTKVDDHRAVYFSVVGSCKGLICVKEETPNYVTIFITNPLTREFFPLPRHRTVVRDIRYHNSLEYMFGFSSLENCFKVIRIRHQNLEPGRSCKIATVGVNRWYWRKCSKIPMLPDMRKIVFVNEFFHWIDMDLMGNLSINTFDIGKEEVGRISQPRGLELRKSCAMSLGKLASHLCLLDSIIPSQVALWKLNEYGAADSWTKDVLVHTCFPFDVDFVRLTPISLSKQGDIVFTDYSKLMSCNSIEGKGSELVTNTYWRPFSIASLLLYEPSFLSVERVTHGGVN